MTGAPRSWTLRLRHDKLPLSLNDRSHWRAIAETKTALRDHVRLFTRREKIPRLAAVHVALYWTPRTRRTRDRDNAVATQKPLVDGLRDYPERRRTVHGRVIVTPPYVGIVPDDDPAHVDYGMPTILPVDPDPFLFERLVFVITERITTA